MKTTKWLVPTIVALGLLALSGLGPTSASAQTPPPAPGQALRRFASNFTAFDGTQILVNEDATAGGIKIYDQTVKTAAGENTLYVTLQATATPDFFFFTCFDVGVAANCEVDGANCNNGFTFDQDADELPPGWIEVTGAAISTGDTSAWMPISYTWCTPIQKSKKNLHEVQIFAAVDEDESGCEQLLQGVSVHVDANKFNKANVDLGNACQGYPNPNPTTEF